MVIEALGLGGILGGGGGGGGGSAGLVGGLLGGGANFLGSFQQNRQAADLRYKIRGGIGGGQADTLRQISAMLASENYGAGANYIRSFFGLGDYKKDMGKTLMGIYGPQFGQGAKGYDPAMAQFNMAMFGSEFGDWQGANQLNTLKDLKSRLQNAMDVGTGAGDMAMVRSLQGMYGRKMDAAGYMAQLDKAIGAKEARSKEMENRGQAYGAAEGKNQFAGDQGPRDYGLGAGNPLAEQYVKNLEKSQRARGLYSGQAAASAEASGLAAFNTQMQMQMLPALMGMSTQPLEMALGAEQQNMNTAILRSTGGKAGFGPSSATFGTNPFSAAAAGFIGGGGLAGAQNVANQAFANLGGGYVPGGSPYSPMSQAYSPAAAGSATGDYSRVGSYY